MSSTFPRPFHNRVKKMLLAGEPALGFGATFNSAQSAELLALAGSDYVIIDNQHGLWQPVDMVAACKALWFAGAVPVGRVLQNTFGHIGAMLDRGALGIIVPMVESAGEARAAVEATRYPPLGRRSDGAYACRHFGPDYRSQANDEILLMVQIESIAAVEAAEEILGVEGVDGCWIGPGDLANTMGIRLASGFGLEEHTAAIRRVLDACRRTGKIPGMWCHSDPSAWLEMGFRFVTPCGEFQLVENGARSLLSRLRGAPPAP